MNKFTSPLNNLKVASPCSADWNEMVGDNRKRFCGACSLNVYNLSGMSREEAETLLQNSERKLCVRFYKRADGTILTEDCPVGWAKIKQRISKTATAAFALFAGLFGGLSAFNFSLDRKEIVMGEMVSYDANLRNGENSVWTQGNVALPVGKNDTKKGNWVLGGKSAPKTK